MVFLPVLVALLYRWGVPVLTLHLQERYQFDLTPYYVLIMSMMILLMPGILGMIFGFLLLDQRDDQTLTALQVTPLTLGRYLVYRTGLPMILSVLITILIFPIAGLIRLDYVPLILTILIAAPIAPLYALFLASFAGNKVQGFALAKAVSAIMWPPMIAFFIPSGWQLTAGVFPTYWPLKLFWVFHDGEGGWWIYLVVGIAYQVALLALLMRRFRRVLHR